MVEFAHLHLHTEFSLLDGMGRINEYIAKAQENNLHHLAVTDHGVMYAAMDWYHAATKAGLHPIIGMEAYLAEGSASARERRSYHLLLLAQNEIGYRNLLRLSTRAMLEGYYYRPRIDLEMLAEHQAGIIATSACLGGPVANNFLHNRPDAARDYASKLTDIFGKERFFIEIQDHGLVEQRQTNRQLIPLAKEMGLDIVATNDVHYCNQNDAFGQDLLVCVQTNATLNDPKRLKTESDQLYLKSPREMATTFGELPHALSNTIKIAEMCSLDLGFRGYQMPDFPVPPGQTPEAYLEELCLAGASEKYGHVDGVVGERLAYELGVIQSMGFTNYFLVVWDFVRFARENGILVGPGRGSAAGSLVTYALSITALDPLKYDLIFERFLNPARISMPDIDIDFADDRRGEVIDYVVRKYGDDRVAQIVTFGTLAAKASVRDVGRAMGRSFAETDRVAKLIPVGPGITIESAMSRVPELKSLYDGDGGVRELIDAASKVEGIARHASTHAAGVVISRDPLVEHVPLQRAGGKSEGEITTQYPMGQLEALGLLKMDFLGLRTLTALGNAIDLLQRAGHDISLETIPLDNDVAYDLLCRGETVGVFQLEGGMTTRMTVDVAPRCFEDLIALMALIRPGPMEMAPDYISRKRGTTPIAYMHPEMESILGETYGIPLYQEQVMQIANQLAGFSMAEGDGLRKAMGKKLPAEMAKYRDRFMAGGAEHGIAKKLAGDIFDRIERFAGYGFNKAHSAAYAVIAAQTAYLKANHPVEFMAAVMTSEIGNTDKIVFNVAECRRTKIAVLGPDINASHYEFGVELDADGNPGIRFGLGAVKNVGAGAIQAIVQARSEQPGSCFSNLDGLCDAVDWSLVNRRVADSLAKCGAFDSFGPRAETIAQLETSIAAAQRRQKAIARGQMGLFEMGVSAPIAVVSQHQTAGPQPTSRELLSWEKELLGLYISAHPLTDVLAKLDLRKHAGGFHQVIELEQRTPGEQVRLIGMVTSVRRITTKTNRTMAIVDFEDLTGTISLVSFPDNYDRFSQYWVSDSMVEVAAKLDRRAEELQLICESVATDFLTMVPAAPASSRTIQISLPLGDDVWRDIHTMHQLDAALRRHEGDDGVEFIIPESSNNGPLILRSRTRKVDWNDLLGAELEEIVGPGQVTIDEGRRAAIAS